MCDACRRAGLEQKRRCGWLRESPGIGTAPVWARKDVATTTCPKSYITAESQTLIEEFFVRRRFSSLELTELSARQVEAFLILENALTAEMNDEQQNTR